MSRFWISLFFFCSLAASAAPSSDPYQIELIRVRAEKDVSAFNFSTPSKIPSSKLETQSSALLTPHLTEIPGLIANQNGGPGGRVSFFMRGTESRHVAFTLDGLKLNDPSNTDRQFDSAFFTAPFLQEVEVHKGPQAVLFGSDSLGGLIEMTTRKGEHAPETRVKLNGGSFGTMESSISHDWKSDQHQGTLTGHRFHSDGLSRLNKKRFNATERDASDITQLTSSSRHEWNSKLQTDFLFSYLRGKNELDGAIDDNSHDESVNDQYLLQQKTHWRASQSSAFSLRNGVNRHQRKLDTLAVGEENYEGDLIQHEVLHSFEKKQFSLLTGVSSEHEQFELTHVDRSFDLHSVFLQSAVRFSDFKLQAGARSEKHVQYGSFHTGSGGIAYALGDALFSVQYSQGFKAPSLYQLYAPPLFGFNIGNRSLVPEVNHSWEGSWDLKKDDFETELTFFQNRLSNLITFTMTQGYLNQSRFIAEGVELSGKIKRESFHLSAGLTHQWFRKHETPVLRRPLNSFMTGVALFPTDNSEITFTGKWFSSRKDISETGNIVKLNAYETIDVGVRYLFPQVDLGIQLLNIFDRNYEELYGYSVMARSVFVHTGFSFQ